MKEKINVFDYSEQIMKALRRGILLSTNGDKFNSMVISWGHFGMIWGEPTFVVYVREHRYTKPQLDKTMEFTLSIPLDKPDPLINKVCGSLSGHHIDKVKEAVPAESLTEDVKVQKALDLVKNSAVIK